MLEQKIKVLPFVWSTQSSGNCSLPADELNVRKISCTSSLAFDRWRSLYVPSFHLRKLHTDCRCFPTRKVGHPKCNDPFRKSCLHIHNLFVHWPEGFSPRHQQVDFINSDRKQSVLKFLAGYETCESWSGKHLRRDKNHICLKFYKCPNILPLLFSFSFVTAFTAFAASPS